MAQGHEEGENSFECFLAGCFCRFLLRPSSLRVSHGLIKFPTFSPIAVGNTDYLSRSSYWDRSSNVAFLAIVSVATIAWVGTYAVPIFFRLTMREEDFKPGPFSLGRWSKPMCAISLLYILYTMAIFMAPNLYPVTVANLNYGPIGENRFALILPGVALSAILTHCGNCFVAQLSVPLCFWPSCGG